MDSFHGVIEQLKKTDNQEECMQQAYEILAKKYHGERFKTISRFWLLFERNIDRLWSRSGFLHCTSLNLLLRKLLLESGKFSPDDVRFRWTLLWGVSPHQYVKIRVNEQWVNVDLWAAFLGIGLGDYAHGFHLYSSRA